MISVQKAEELILAAAASTQCLKECADAIAAGARIPGDKGGYWSAGDAAATLKNRQKSTREAGASTCGFGETIAALRRRAPMEQLVVFHFKTPERIFSVFFDQSDSRVLGCIRVVRRHEPS